MLLYLLNLINQTKGEKENITDTNVKTLRGDKVSVLPHTYPHKPVTNIEVTICNHQADSPLYVWPDV